MSLCPYKDALGTPKKGIHSYRFMGLAIADVGMTILAAGIIAFLFNTSFLYTSIALFALGILAHRLFCVRTTIDTLLFPAKNDEIPRP